MGSPPTHRRRDVDAREAGDDSANAVADEEQDARERNGLNEIETERHANVLRSGV